MDLNSELHKCPGCGAAVIGHETCGDPTRPECARPDSYDLLAAHPEPMAGVGAYGEYGVRYTSGPRKWSMPRRFRDLADAVEFVAAGNEEMVVLHRVVTEWTEVEL